MNKELNKDLDRSIEDKRPKQQKKEVKENKALSKVRTAVLNDFKRSRELVKNTSRHIPKNMAPAASRIKHHAMNLHKSIMKKALPHIDRAKKAIAKHHRKAVDYLHKKGYIMTPEERMEENKRLARLKRQRDIEHQNMLLKEKRDRETQLKKESIERSRYHKEKKKHEEERIKSESRKMQGIKKSIGRHTEKIRKHALAVHGHAKRISSKIMQKTGKALRFIISTDAKLSKKLESSHKRTRKEMMKKGLLEKKPENEQRQKTEESVFRRIALKKNAKAVSEKVTETVEETFHSMRTAGREQLKNTRRFVLRSLHDIGITKTPAEKKTIAKRHEEEKKREDVEKERREAVKQMLEKESFREKGAVQKERKNTLRKVMKKVMKNVSSLIAKAKKRSVEGIKLLQMRYQQRQKEARKESEEKARKALIEQAKREKEKKAQASKDQAKQEQAKAMPEKGAAKSESMPERAADAKEGAGINDAVKESLKSAGSFFNKITKRIGKRIKEKRKLMAEERARRMKENEERKRREDEERRKLEVKKSLEAEAKRREDEDRKRIEEEKKLKEEEEKKRIEEKKLKEKREEEEREKQRKIAKRREEELKRIEREKARKERDKRIKESISRAGSKINSLLGTIRHDIQEKKKLREKEKGEKEQIRILKEKEEELEKQKKIKQEKDIEVKEKELTKRLDEQKEKEKALLARFEAEKKELEELEKKKEEKIVEVSKEQIEKAAFSNQVRKKKSYLEKLESNELKMLAVRCGATVRRFPPPFRSTYIEALMNYPLDDIKTIIIEKHKKEEMITPVKPAAKELDIIGKEIEKQRMHAKGIKSTKAAIRPKLNFVKTGIEGFDDLIKKGVPKGSNIVISGASGTGKTIFSLQALYNAAKRGDKCIYISLEERPEKLLEYMKIFGWNAEKYIKKGNLIIQRLNPLNISTSIEALLAKARGELLIEANPVLIPEGFEPDWIVVDSLGAFSSAFGKAEENYRVYIEELFKYLEGIKATTLLISETEELPKIGMTRGRIEDFLADAIVILYHIRRGNIRQRAVEILKMRGVEHEEKVVAMQIVDKQGMVIYPEQEVFGGLE